MFGTSLREVARYLEFATACSFAGMGFPAIAAANKLPQLFLPPGAGILGYTALTSVGHLGTVMLIVVDFVLLMGVLGWVLRTWRPR